MLVFAACTDEIDFHEDVQGKDCITLKVFNRPMTKAAGDDAYESHLTRLDVFFYVEGQTDRNCVYYQEVLDPDNNYQGGVIPFYVVDEQINMIFPDGNETCDVFVIANLPDELRTFDTDPEGGYSNTEYNRLSAILLEMDKEDEDGNQLPQLYDAIGKDFVMAGFDGNVRRDISTNNAEGTVKLIRAASKITVKINIPAKIVLDPDSDNPVTMVPVLEVEDGNGETVVPIVTSLHNKVKQGYLFPNGMIDTGMQVLPDDCYMETSEVRYRKIKEIDEDVEPGPEKYQYECEIPFYSYPSLWQKGDEHAAHFSLEIPWRRDTEDSKSYHPYYYQILINATDRCLKPNHWYDMIVNVGVIGSSVELTPVPLHDLTFYVMDWTTQPDPSDAAGGDRYEDLEIEEYTYFSVPQKRIEMNNTTVGELKFVASHNVRWALEWPTDTNIQSTFDEMEKEYHTGTVAAYYVNCGGDAPEQRDLSRFIQESDFSLSASGKSLTFNFPKAEIDAYNDTQANNANKYNIYSPVYVHLKVWLDINGDGQISEDLDEDEFVEYVTFVYYPAMYIEPDLSNPYSIYVNNVQHNNQNDAYSFKAGSTTHNLGRAPGVSGSWGTKDSYMYTITVSSFTSGNTFKAHDGNFYPYIIGDPRQRTSDLEMDDDGQSNVASNWVSANAIVIDENGNAVKDANGNIQYVQRPLQYYYPTSTEGNSFQIVSPKFKIVSFHSSGWGSITSKGAEMRCATFQEDGYPAGRWRLPTEAEIMFIIDLQKADVISDIFYGSSNYYTATEVDNTNTSRYRINCPTNGNPSWSTGTTGSVRCVYDEWYWGPDREAMKNPNYNENYNNNGLDNNERHANNEYLFTWGDRQIWPE